MKKLQSMKSFLAIVLSLCLVLGSISPMSANAAEEGAGSAEGKTECELNGHDYEIVKWNWSADNSKCDVELVCKRDSSHRETREAKVRKNTTPPTCETDGQETITASIELNGKTEEHTYSHTLSKTGHAYKFDKWEWAEDYSSAKALLVCANDKSHKSSVDATITKEEVEPTCLEAGTITYTATAVVNGSSVTDKKVVPGKKALGHNYQDTDWLWTEDFSGASVVITCANDPEDSVTLNADVTREDDYTCTEDGKRVYHASVNYMGKNFSDTITVMVHAPGHQYGEPVFNWTGTESAEAVFTCSVCGNTEVVPCVISSVDYEETESAHGKTEYTAACVFQEETFENLVVVVYADHEAHMKLERVLQEDGSYDDITSCMICGLELDRNHVDYTLEYNSNGGNGTMTSQVAEYGKPATLAENRFANKGYYFKGWYAQRISDGCVYAVLDDGTEGWYSETELQEMHQDGYTFEAGAQVKDLTDVNDDKIVLYACWEKVVYKVTFDANGGKGSMTDMTVTYGEAQKLNENTYTRSGYQFNGWYAHRRSDDKWYAKNADGKKGWYSETVIENKGYTKVTYSDKGTISTATAVNEDLIQMVACWKANSYTVVYKANGGSGSMSESNMKYGTKTALKANKFKKTGYHFSGWNVYRESDQKYYAINDDGRKGWYTEEELEDNDFSLVVLKDQAKISTMTKVNKDTLTLTAIWKANTYTITFDANGGSKTMKDMKVTYGKTVKLAANKFTKKGYTFKGWYAYRTTDKKWYAKNTAGKKGWHTSATIKEKGYTVVVLKDKASVGKLNSVDKATVKMKAVWKK